MTAVFPLPSSAAVWSGHTKACVESRNGRSVELDKSASTGSCNDCFRDVSLQPSTNHCCKDIRVWIRLARRRKITDQSAFSLLKNWVPCKSAPAAQPKSEQSAISAHEQIVAMPELKPAGQDRLPLARTFAPILSAAHQLRIIHTPPAHTPAASGAPGRHPAWGAIAWRQ